VNELTRQRLAYTLATWFGCGRVSFAPGTLGTLAALPLYALSMQLGGEALVACVALLLLPIAIWSAGRVAASLAAKDPQLIVIDEVVGVLLTLSAARGWVSVALGVLLFRLFDQWKPWPARWVERNLPGGYGIVMDDVVAGLLGALCLLLGRSLLEA
jgi:phosphatidylglycerophosphatase A